MKFSEALDQTLNDYGISAKWLSEESGVSMQMISQFRRGKQRVYSDSLEAIINAFPQEIRWHFCSLIFSKKKACGSDLEHLIATASEPELEAAMLQIVRKIFPGDDEKFSNYANANEQQSRVKFSIPY
jgi:transcriptional regulator with XRE-family HTH domain